MPPHKSSGWGGPAGDERCRSSYSYWTWEETSFLKLTNKPVVVDSLVRIPHRKRGMSFIGDVAGKPFGINALFGDGHVNMTLVSNTPEILDYINQADWGTRANDYNGFVGALRMMKP
jgi:prepilin-type processing-associated H-X9-DG protein